MTPSETGQCGNWGSGTGVPFHAEASLVPVDTQKQPTLWGFWIIEKIVTQVIVLVGANEKLLRNISVGEHQPALGPLLGLESSLEYQLGDLKPL